MGNHYIIRQNLFTNNSIGAAFLPTAQNLDYGYGTNAAIDLELRYNTFNGIIINAVGVQVKANTRFLSVLGSASQLNGNRLDGLANNASNVRFKYEGLTIPFTYYNPSGGAAR